MRMAYFLPKDQRALAQKIAKVGDSMIAASLDGGDWTQQSAETWHDNFGYEEGERQKYAIGTRLKELEQLQKTIQQPVMPTDNEVAIGTVVTLTRRHHVTGAHVPHTVAISSYMVLELRRDDEISYNAPLAQALLGAHVGDVVEYSAGGTKHSATVEKIGVAAELFAD